MCNNENFKIIILGALLLSSFSLSGLSLEHPLMIDIQGVEPVKYPKFSVALNYNMERNFSGLADKKLRIALANEIGALLTFEAGLYKYFNAGAQLSFGIPPNLSVPLHLGLGLFAKPYFPLGERCSFFSRLGLGISASQGGMKAWLAEKSQRPGASEIKNFFGENQYFDTAFGANAHVSVGFEYFPWPLFGFALEGGVRADIFRERGLAKNNKDAPPNFDYVTYEFPLALMIHVIL
jgi:hypothetical protein